MEVHKKIYFKDYLLVSKGRKQGVGGGEVLVHIGDWRYNGFVSVRELTHQRVLICAHMENACVTIC